MKWVTSVFNKSEMQSYTLGFGISHFQKRKYIFESECEALIGSSIPCLYAKPQVRIRMLKKFLCYMSISKFE
jgi:hypothetical protein